MQFLIDHMTDLTRLDENGNNPVIWSAFRGRYEALTLLLKAQASNKADSRNLKASVRPVFDPDYQNTRYGNTALHYAAYRAHVNTNFKRCVLVLLKYGASPHVQNKRGQRPRDLLDPQETELWKRLEYKESSSNKREEIFGVDNFSPHDITGGREKFSIPWINEVDNEPGPPPFVYIRQPVGGENVKFPGRIQSEVSCNCGWKGGCRSESLLGKCDCAKVYEDREFPYNFSNSEISLSSRVLAKQSNDFVIYECSSSCSCSIDECPNRVVQRGISVRLYVKKTELKGWACYTSEKIKKGTFVLEYVGEVINEVDAEERSMRNAHKCSYIWSLDPKMDELSEHHYAVDADRFGNVARFLNHCCDPNLVAREAFIHHRNPKFPRIAFFARRDILPDEELTFDYCYELLTIPANGQAEYFV
jgi:euchromatic histone-lysine N-methyltransferase